ncbi:hypothetical protein Cci01nite_08390 [Catellatospora citrea]|uniref:Uncharacterized protein n=1 Tax=Catellatospora citrea TaxID=53366 RepID=A0A8J3KEH8_9ACTN|nr:hypothetical protein Cci01nite_08390 [Catellatospora citrea]
MRPESEILTGSSPAVVMALTWADLAMERERGAACDISGTGRASLVDYCGQLRATATVTLPPSPASPVKPPSTAP